MPTGHSLESQPLTPFVVLPFQMLIVKNKFTVVARHEGVENWAGFACAVCKQGTTTPLFVSNDSWTFLKHYEVIGFRIFFMTKRQLEIQKAPLCENVLSRGGGKVQG